MDWSSLLTDSYDRKARLYPALLIISPLVALGFAVLSDSLSLIKSFGILVLGSGGAFLLAQLGRDLGKDGEQTLYRSWGGMPSVAIFRHRDTRLDAITKARYHKQLTRVVKTNAPTAQEEHKDPNAADAIYTAWSNYLRTNTRDKNTFQLLHKENLNYGYRRNVWGLRLIGSLAGTIGTLISAARLYLVYQSNGNLDVPAGMAGIFSLVLLILCTFYFTADWVRIPADSYAARLAESLEVLHPINK